MSVFITDFARSKPDAPAVVVGRSGTRVSYRELDERSRRFAGLLDDIGLERGDHLAVVMENRAEYYEVVWAGLRSGLYVTAINSHLTAPEAAYIVQDCGARVLVTGSGVAELADALIALTPAVDQRLMIGSDARGHLDYEPAISERAPRSPDEDQRGLVMLYSSGTTGRPKGIRFPLPPAGSALGEWEIAEHSRQRYGFEEHMVYLSPAPLYHAAPLRVSLAVQCVGGTVVVMERFDPQEALALIETERVTHSQWVPTMFVRMLKLPPEKRAHYDLSSHRVAVHAAAPCPVTVKEQMIDWWGPILEEYYAGTENIGSTSITSEEWLGHKGSVGRPSGQARIHICDDEGALVPVGETGIVYFEDPTNVFEYHGDQDKTRAVSHPLHPRWRSLGDIGHLDEDGYLYLTDRRAFMIVSGGVNIYPQEIEDVLVAHPKLADAAVFGVPHEEMGEVVKAVVQPLDEEDAGDELAEELKRWCADRLATYKIPRSFDFERQLPRLDNGKLYKTALRKRYWEGRQARVS